MKSKTWIILAFALAGCGLMRAMGLADEAGAPTDLGETANAAIASLTGLDVLKSWGLIKSAEALFTKPGLQNLATVLSPGATWKGTWQSLLRLLGIGHTPAEAKAETASV